MTGRGALAVFKIIISTLLVSFVLVTSVSSEESEELQIPRLFVAESAFDFGTAVEGDKIEHIYELVNQGDAELTIQKVVAGCGCVIAEMPQTTIAPGDKTALKVVFDTGGFSGEQSKLVRVFSNDPKAPAIPLTIQGRVSREVVAEPSLVSFGDIFVGRERKRVEDREVLIKVRDGSPVVIDKIVARSRFFVVEEQESSPKLLRLRVNLKGDKEIPLGDLRERIVVVLSGGKLESLNIPLLATLRSAVSLHPEVLSLGILEGTAIIERKVDLIYSGDDRVDLNKVSSDHAAVQARFETIRPGRRHRIYVSVDPKKVKKELRALITISTVGEDSRALALPVYGILPPERIRE